MGVVKLAYAYTFKQGDSRKICYSNKGYGITGLFEFSNVESVVIPDGIKYIGYGAFSDCENLTSITIPDSVIEMETDAFYNCTNLPAENGIIYAGKFLVVAQSRNQSSYTIKNGTKWIGDGAFYNCFRCTSITIPDSVTAIGKYAFNLSGIVNYTIGSGLTSFVSDYNHPTFYHPQTITVSQSNTKYDSRDNCNAIIETATNKLLVGSSSTVIPETVLEIDDYAFRGNASLSSIVIPSGVTYIGPNAFENCRSLSSVTISATTPPTVVFESNPTATSAFDGNASGRKIYVPSTSVDAYKAAPGWSQYASDIEPIP